MVGDTPLSIPRSSSGSLGITAAIRPSSNSHFRIIRGINTNKHAVIILPGGGGESLSVISACRPAPRPVAMVSQGAGTRFTVYFPPPTI